MKHTTCVRIVLLGVSVMVPVCHGAAQGSQASTSDANPPASQSVQEPPSKPSALTPEQRADVYMARKSYADAIDYYYRALKQTKMTSPVLWNKLGIAYQQQMNYRAARKAYNQAIRRKKDFSEPLNNIGTVYFLQGKYSKTLKYYRRALLLNPTSATFHLNLGSSYYHLKNYKEAVDEYRTALNLNPNVLTDRSAVGTIMQARSADPEYFFYMAKVFASLGRAEDAVRYLRRAFEDGLKADNKKIEEDSDFQKISEHPAFIELLKNRPLPIKD